MKVLGNNVLSYISFGYKVNIVQASTMSMAFEETARLQVELFAESFFKLPLLRRLEEDMIKIELSKAARGTVEGYGRGEKRLTHRRLSCRPTRSARAHGVVYMMCWMSVLTSMSVNLRVIVTSTHVACFVVRMSLRARDLARILVSMCMRA